MFDSLSVRPHREPEPVLSSLTRLAFIVALAFACCGLTSCTRKADQPGASSLVRLSWPTDRAGTASVELAIPSDYLLLEGVAGQMDRHVYGSAKPPSHRLQELLLTALWPELKPEVEAIRAETKVPGGGKLNSSLLTSAAIGDEEGKHFNLLQIAYDIAIQWSTQMLCVAPYQMTANERTAEAKCFKRQAPDTKPSEFGLQRLGVDFAHMPDLPKVVWRDMAAQDIYFKLGPTGELQTVILCTAEEAKSAQTAQSLPLVPQCEHKFIVPKINGFMSIGYRREYLKDWVSIQERWSELVGSFVVSAAQDNTRTH